jgi:hypothetical protein
MEEEKNATIIELAEDEKENMKTRLELIEKQKTALGALRRQYLASERQMLDALGQSESDYISQVKMFSQMKKIPTDTEKWVFDPTGLHFRKIE